MASPVGAVDLQSTASMIATLRACTHDVFATMVGIPLAEGPPIDGDALRPHSHEIIVELVVTNGGGHA